LIANDAESVPAEIVTELGVTALFELLESLISRPPGGAEPVRLTNPVQPAPPVTAFGDTAIEFKAGGLTVRVVVMVCDPRVAAIVAVTVFATPFVRMTKEVLAPPGGIVTEAGTVTPSRLLLSLIT
jgi:hypothetical protein